MHFQLLLHDFRQLEMAVAEFEQIAVAVPSTFIVLFGKEHDRGLRWCRPSGIRRRILER